MGTGDEGNHFFGVGIGALALGDLAPTPEHRDAVGDGNTSCMLWLISTTPRPPSASRWRRERTFRVSDTASTAVGSSMITSRASRCSARQMATACR
jgi:hypothetical protein